VLPSLRKRIDLELKLVDISRRARQPAYAALNPNALVPIWRR